MSHKKSCDDASVNSGTHANGIAGDQIDKFKQAARELETDDDPERFKDRLKKLVRHKPVEKTVADE